MNSSTKKKSPLFLAASLSLATACSASTNAQESTVSQAAQPSPKVLIVLTNHGQLGDTGKSTGFYLSELTHPYHVFKEAGFEITLASPKGGKAPMDGVDRKDVLNAAFLDTPSLVSKTEKTIPLADINPADYRAIFFSGGHGTMWDFPKDAQLQNLSAAIYQAGGVVAAVCHGPAALVNIKLKDGEFLISGKEITGFTNAEEDAVGLSKVVPFALESRLVERGAKFSGAANFQAHVKVSERVVTGQNPASATGVAQEVVKLLK